MADPMALRRGRRRRPAPSSSSACPRPSSTWPRRSSTWPPRRRATGPRSAIWNARERRARRRRRARCRRTCATPTTAARRSLGHGAGYEYPHDDPRGWLPQQYLPDELADRRYYEPVGARLRGRGGPPQEARRTMPTTTPGGRRPARTRSAGHGEPPDASGALCEDDTTVACSAGGRVRSCGDRRGAGHRPRDGAVLARLRGADRRPGAGAATRCRTSGRRSTDLRAETRPLLERAALVASTRRATTSSASTGCSARPRRSRRTWQGVSGSPGSRCQHAGHQDGGPGRRARRRAARRLRRKEVS